MFDPGSALSFATTTGIEALKILNAWLDSAEIGRTWYGEDKRDFLRTRFGIAKLFRGKFFSPEIGYVFTIRRDDWQPVIKESLPVAHTWYHKRIDQAGECSWLPLFWACRDRLGKKRVCSKAGKAFNYLGVVSNMPAARLDLWGLVVMAYANGGWTDIISSEEGRFKATLHAKNFVLTISQSSVDAPIIGHLEPREHPSEDYEPLGTDESTFLLNHGQSFSPSDVTIGWSLNGDFDTPPKELTDGRWDCRLRKVVLDIWQIHKLKRKLRKAIIDYREAWESFMVDVRGSFAGASNTDLKINLMQVREYYSVAERAPERKRYILSCFEETTSYNKTEKSQAEEGINNSASVPDTRNSASVPETGNSASVPDTRNSASASDTANSASVSTTTGSPPLPYNWRQMIEEVHGLIVHQLWRMKLIFDNDDVKLLDNFDRRDALYVFQKEARLLEVLTRSHLPDFDVDHSPAGISAKQVLKHLLRQHQVVMARARMLKFSNKVDEELSARNTGFNVLLA